MTSSGPYRVATGLVELDAESARLVQDLPLGVSASVTLIVQEATGVLLVPAAALRETPDGQYTVLVAGSDGQVTPQTVQVGLSNDTYAEITSGLEEGQMVSAGLATGSSAAADEAGEMQMMFPPGGAFQGDEMPAGGAQGGIPDSGPP
jgi:HlyD family secretion protein